MKIIIVGCGKVGSTLVNQLSGENHNITLIDTNREILESNSIKYDVMGVVGNGASFSILMEAGIIQADILIAVTGSDELNLLCCLIAKKAGNCRTIARVRNPIYSKEINFIKEELGLSMIINPELTAANEIARLLHFPSAIKIDTFARGRVELLEVQIPKGSILHEMRISEISQHLKCKVLICAIERESGVIIPSGNVILRELDKISIVAATQDAIDFFEKINIITNQVKDTILVGGGTITYYLAKQLLEMGVQVKIIEIDRKRCEELSDVLPGAIVIQGDGTNQELLREEGIEYAQSFASLTNVDEENIILSLYVGRNSKAKLITKVNRLTCEDIIEDLDLGSTIYPKYLTSDYILQYVRALQNTVGSNVETLYKIIGNRAEAMAFTVKTTAPLIGIALEDLKLRENLLICCIIRKGMVRIPRGKDSIQVDDTVIVVTTQTGLNDISDILR